MKALRFLGLMGLVLATVACSSEDKGDSDGASGGSSGEGGDGGGGAGGSDDAGGGDGGTMDVVDAGPLEGGGSGGASAEAGVQANDFISGIALQNGTMATFHEGELPRPRGSVIVDIPAGVTGISGGTTTITIDPAGEIQTVYVAVEGTDGYYEIPVPAGTDIVDLLVTLAQELSDSNVPILISVMDMDGNVSAPATVDTSVMEVGGGDVQVSVSWDVENDIDLSVTDPNGFTIDYSTDVSPEGGTLDLDSNAACAIDGIKNESISWPTGTAPSGEYTVQVTSYENCSGLAANYVVTVRVDGAEPQTFTGTFAAADPDLTVDDVATFVVP